MLNFKVISILTLLICLCGCSLNNFTNNTTTIPKLKPDDYKSLLDSGKIINIKKSPLVSNRQQEYNIYVDNIEVAKVKGPSDTKKFSNTFILIEEGHGNTLLKMEYHKEWAGGFMAKSAKFKDNHNNIIGYMSEKLLSSLTNANSSFYLSDSSHHEFGKVEGVNLLNFKNYDFKNNDGTVEYTINKQYLSYRTEYKVDIKDNKKIPLYLVLLMVCTQDAIE
jgi:uncharacterized protein YxjI